MEREGHSKLILPTDKQPLEFSYQHHEYFQAGISGDKSPDQLLLRCPNIYSGLALLLPVIDFFLKGLEHQPFRTINKCIINVSDHFEDIIGVIYFSG